MFGLAIGTALLKMDSSLKVSIFKEESRLGFHVRGRNSDVIHASFYYSPRFPKASFCISGNQALAQLINRYDLSLRKTRKIVVTQERSQLDDLIALQQRSVANGINLELLEGSQLKN